MRSLSSEEVRWRQICSASNAGHCALTLAHTRRFLADWPEFWPAWVEQGTALYEMGCYPEAEQALQQALALRPKRGRHLVLCHLGHLNKARGDSRQAAGWYRRAARADPDNASPLIYLGAALAKQGRLRDAEKVHRAATRCPKGCLEEAFFNLGLVLRAQERHHEAAECFREAIRREPKYRGARRALRDVELAGKLAGEPA